MGVSTNGGAHVEAPGWSKIVDVKEKDGSSAIYLKTDGKQTGGIVIVSAEAEELTVVQIIGPIDPSMLSELGGKMGIPKIELDSKQKTAPSKKDD